MKSMENAGSNFKAVCGVNEMKVATTDRVKRPQGSIVMAERSNSKAVCYVHYFSSGYIYAPSVILTALSTGTTLVESK